MKMFQSARFSSNKKDKYLVVGLGNPGKKYVDTRHNVGFEMLDAVAAYFDIKVTKIKCKALIGEGKIGGKNVILAKPQTYMNLSGESVRELCSYYKISHENVYVIFDDVSLNVGKIRIRQKGSAGGHNGIKNIIYHLNTDLFPRIKIGVGEPDCDIIDYVLGKFSKNDIEALTQIAKEMPGIVDIILNEGIEPAMNKFN